MTVHLDNFFFNKAVHFTEISESAQEQSEHLKSWLATVPARVCYVADSLVSSLYFGGASCLCLITAPVALYKWKWSETYFGDYAERAKEKYIRIFSSATGIFVVGKGKSPEDNFFAHLLAGKVVVIAATLTASAAAIYSYAYATRPLPYRV